MVIKKNKLVGIITFHNSYNCGSMLQAYALQNIVEKLGYNPEIIDFSNNGQKSVYSVKENNNSLKNIIKNIILRPHRTQIKLNFDSYENFKNKNFNLSSKSYTYLNQLSDDSYDAVIAGSDQVWNITIEDGDDAYFLPWVKQARKIAYAPSFGSKNISKYAKDPNKYKKYIASFDDISIRENNGKKWIKELTGINCNVVLDPTLLLKKEDYERIMDTNIRLPKKYIFFYSPGYQKEIVDLVSNISKKYNLPVIAFNTKTFYVKGIQHKGFTLPSLENPSTYLALINYATLVITTSFHGTVFSTIFRKKFWTIKNGGMFGDDDRVKTLIEQLCVEDRLIAAKFDNDFNYLASVNYKDYEEKLPILQSKSIKYLKESLENINEK